MNRLHPFRVGKLLLYLPHVFPIVPDGVPGKGTRNILRRVFHGADDLPGDLFSFVIRHGGAVIVGEKTICLNQFPDEARHLAPRPVNTGIRRADGSMRKRQSFAGIERIVVPSIRTAVLPMNIFHVRFPRLAFRVGKEEGIDAQPVIMVVLSAAQQMVDFIV